MHVPILCTGLCIHHFLPTILEHTTLYKCLSAHTCVYSSGLLVVIVVEDVRCAEAEKWTTTIDFVKVVISVGNTQVAGIFSSVLVGVANESAFR